MDIIMGMNVTASQAVADGPSFKVGTMGSISDAVTGNVKDFMYVKSTTGITDVGYVGIVNPVLFDASMLTSTNGAAGAGVGFPLGVASCPIVAGGWGWLQVYGSCQLRTSAATALGTQLNTTATAGALSATATATSTTQVSGMTLTVAAGAAALTAGYITYPTAFEVN
jgi:hypothetical protein